MIINNINKDIKKVSFKGMEQAKSNTGYTSFDFYLPYDQDKYTKAEIEFVQLKKEGTDFVVDQNYPPKAMPLMDGKITVNPAKIALSDQPFAYRFKLTSKEGNKETITYHTDSGLRTENIKKNTDEAKYVVVFRDRAPITNPGGTIIHLMSDSHNPGYEMKDGELVLNKEGKPLKNEALAKQALNSKRNHFSQYGGNIAGIIQDIQRMQEMGYDFVLATPIFGGDERSSHGYWTSNPFQMTRKNGTDEDFKTLNVELFKKGMSLIADGAFVNEGMEGYRLKHVQKWGKESPYYNNFRITGNITIANIPNFAPDSKEGKEIFPHIKLNIVNANNTYSFNKNDINITPQKRDFSKLTYVQIYDERLLSVEQQNQVNKGQLITKYENYTTTNHYEINNNNHSAILNAFEVPEDEIVEFEKRIKNSQKDYTKNRLSFLQSSLKFKNFNIDTQVNGFETWDGNVDIAKLRYGFTNGDEEKMTLLGCSKEEKRQALQGAYQNQDYIQKVARHWTKMTKDALIEYSVKELKDVKTGESGYRAIFDQSKDKFPAHIKDAMTPDVIKNVMNNSYLIPQLGKTANVRTRLTEDLMNTPLESIGFSPDVTAVLGSPFISKKAFNAEDVQKTRYEFHVENGYKKIPDRYSDIYYSVDQLYTNSDKSLVEFAHDVIKKADTNNQLINKETNELTDSGKLILPLLSNDILKFAVVKALAPNVKIENKNGKLIYDEKALREVSLKNIGGKGISVKSPEDEAKQVIELMKKGIANISDNDKKLLADNIKSRFENVKESDIKMAYVLVDRTASGLNWRTDATKDTAAIGEVRDDVENLGSVMDEAIDFWAGFTKAIKSENPNSYIIAEMTDILGGEDSQNAVMRLSGGSSGRHQGGLSLERAFTYETGVTGLSNYNFFFSPVLGAVSPSADTGKYEEPLHKKYTGIVGTDAWGNANNKGFLFNSPQDAIKTSHNFATNHDKPRLLSLLALDMRLFHGKREADELTAARKLYTPDFEKNGLTPNYHAIAMAKGIDSAMGQAIDELGLKNTIDKGKITGALQDLAQGRFHDGKEFNPSAFGVAPLHFTINDTIIQAEKKHGLSLNDKQRTDLFNKTLDKMLSPALEKMLIIDKIYTILPGRNTSYSGDEYGMTGYESPCKNIYAQNRSVAHRDWINDPNKGFINTYYQQKKEINNIRKNSGLSALSQGETAWLKNITPLMNEKEKAKAAEKPEFNDEFKGKYNDSITAIFRYDMLSELICLVHTKNVIEGDRLGKGEHEFLVDTTIQPEIEKIDLSEEKHDGTVVAGLAGGLALGTYFMNGIKESKDTNVYGVCKEGEKYVVKGFEKKSSYENYLKDATKYANEARNIVLRDNLTILKKSGNILKEAARVAFQGNHNPNHIKIQAYLNSKQYLNSNQRNAI